MGDHKQPCSRDHHRAEAVSTDNEWESYFEIPHHVSLNFHAQINSVVLKFCQSRIMERTFHINHICHSFFLPLLITTSICCGDNTAQNSDFSQHYKFMTTRWAVPHQLWWLGIAKTIHVTNPKRQHFIKQINNDYFPPLGSVCSSCIWSRSDWKGNFGNMQGNLMADGCKSF